MKEKCIQRYLGMALTLVLLMYGAAFASIPPLQITSLTGNPLYTASATVKLNISYADAVQMQILTNNTTWSTWVPYAATRTAILPAGAGVKSVSVRFRDAAGNTSPIYRSSIVLDIKAPAGSVAIEAGAAETETLVNVTLSLTAADDNGVTLMRFSNNGITWSGWEPFAATKTSYTLSGTAGIAGTKKVIAQFKDSAGRVSAAVYDTILYVTSPKPTFTPGAVTISNSKGGSDFTTATGVKLTISNPDSSYTQMSLSRNGILWGGWFTIPTAPISYYLTAGDGIKTVYARFRAGTTGTASAAYGDTIILDTKPPVGTMVMNGGAYSTGNPNVTLSLYATDLNGVASMQFFNGITWNTPVPYAETMSSTFPSVNGVKRLYVRFIDSAGKVSATVSDTIILDTTVPVGTVKINSGAAITMNPVVTLSLAAPGATEMNLSIDEGANWGGWEPFAASRKVSLPEGAGVKTVSVKFRDVTGNESTPVSDSITLNALQGVYKVVGRESSFYQSLWQDGLTHVTDNLWGSRATATFNGAGKCSIAVTSTGYDKLNNGGGGESVKTHLESFSSSICTYTGPDADGAFAIAINGKEELSGRVAFDGNSVVMGGATSKEMEGGTSYDVDEMIGVRVAASGITAASMSGTYNLVSQEGSFWAGGGFVSDSIFGDRVSATFNGTGGCSVTMNGEGYYPDGNGGITVEPENNTFSCTYTVTTTGAFTMAITTPERIEKVTGWASADGNSVVMGGANQNTDLNGTSYNTHLASGVKAGTGMGLSSVTGTYHLTGSEIAFWSGSNVSKNYWGSHADIVFNGSGACTLTGSSKGYHVETDNLGNESVGPPSSDSQTITDCSYSIDPVGRFTVTMTTPEGVENVSGWASADGNSVVMGGPGQEAVNGGTNYRSELMFGVRVKP